jgi:hypothetical protein
VGGGCLYGVGDASTVTVDAGSTVPPDPGGPAPDGGAPLVLAFSKLYFGDRDPSGQVDAQAWKQYGLNIDGKITTRVSTDVCTLALGAPRDTQTDGDNGIDNSFGANILPILVSTAGDFPAAANANIGSGVDATSLVRIDQLGPGPSYSPLSAFFYKASPTPSPPAWNGSDVFDVDSESLDGGNLDSPLLAFPASYMSQRTLVTAPPTGAGTIALGLQFNAGIAPPIPITHVQIVANVAADGSKANGMISGILPTSAFVAWVHQIVGDVAPSLCGGAAFQSIAAAITQAADIMTDGTNPSGAPCDGISIGMGFDATAVKLGGVVTVSTEPSSCP